MELKLNKKRTSLIGFAFFGILLLPALPPAATGWLPAIWDWYPRSWATVF